VVIHKSEDVDGNQTVTDLTGYTAKMQIRKRVTDTVSVLDVSCGVTDAVNGEITCIINKDQTASYSFL
jgi:hypothetical protein